MSRAGITVSIKGEINDLEAKITQSKEIINKATSDIINKNQELKDSQKSLNEVQKTYTQEIQSANKEIQNYLEVKSKNGKLSKEEQQSLAAARAELALYKSKTKELVDVEKEKIALVKQSIEASKKTSEYQKIALNDIKEELDIKKKVVSFEKEYQNALRETNNAIDSKLQKQDEERNSLRNEVIQYTSIEKVITNYESKVLKLNDAVRRKIITTDEYTNSLKILNLELAKTTNVKQFGLSGTAISGTEIKSETSTLEKTEADKKYEKQKYQVVTSLLEQKRREEELNKVLADKAIQDKIEADKKYEKQKYNTVSSLLAQKRAEEANNQQLKETFDRTYKNTQAQNSYNDAVKHLNTLKTAGIISGNDFNSALKKEKDALVQSDIAAKNKEKSTSNLANTTIRYLKWAGTIAGVVYGAKRAWDLTVGSGIAVNKMIEDNTSGIAALLSANTRMSLSNGQIVNSYEKFQIAGVKATSIMEELRVASTKTYATFPQLTGIYQQMIGHTMSMGDRMGTTVDDISKNTIELSKILSNIGGAIGMEMQKVNEEARSIISGSASTDSLIAMMVFGSPTQANEAMKKAKERGTNGVKDMLMGVLDSYKVLEGVKTYTRAQLELQDQISRSQELLSKPTYNALKDVYMDLSVALKQNEKDFKEWGERLIEGAKFVVEYGDDIAKLVITYKTLDLAMKTSSAFAAGLGATNAAAALTFSGMAIPIGIAVTAYIAYNELIGKVLDKEERLAKIRGQKLPDLNSLSTTSIESDARTLQTAINDIIDKRKELSVVLNNEKNKWGLRYSEEDKKAAREADDLAKKEYEKLLQEKQERENLLKTRKEILETAQKALDIQNKEADLIVKIGGDTKILEDQKDFLKKNEEEIVGLTKKRKEWSDDLLKNEKNLAEVKQNQPNDIEQIAALEKLILGNKTSVLALDKEIAEVNKKTSDKTISKLETEANKKKEANKLDAKSQAAELELSMLQSGQIDEERLKISLSELQIKILAQEASILNNGLEKTEKLIALEREKLNLKKLQNDEEEKKQKQYKFDKISGVVKYADMENLGQIYQELSVYYKEDPESLADLETWVEREQNKLSKKPLVIDIKLQGWDEVSNSIATFGNSFQDINKAQKKYQQENEKVKKDEVALNQARVDLKDTTISGIADMTGAVASFYDEDDDRRKKQLELQKVFYGAKMAMQVAELAQSTAFTSLFVTQEAAKGASAGATAVAVAAQSSPWTGFATAAAMIALMASLGIMIGGKTKTSTTSDAFSAQKANIGTGSVLGDSTKASESITEALEILKDFARPEYQTLQSMNNYLKNIAGSIGGVASLLVQNSPTALGTNYTGGFNTGYKNNIGLSNSPAGSLGMLGGGAAFGAFGGSLGYGAISALGLGGGVATLGSSLLAGSGIGLGVLAADKLLLGGVLTKAIGGITNSVMGGLFGKTKVSQALTDSGITFAKAYLKDAVNQLNGSTYQTISTTVSKKSWFSSSSSTSVNTYFSKLDQEVSSQFSLVLSNLYNTVEQAGNALELSSSNLNSSLNNFVVSIGKISLKGKTGTQIQTQLTNIFSKISDDLAKATIPGIASFQHVGEGLFNTLTRVTSGIKESEYYISKLGQTFSNISYSDIVNKQGDIGFEALLQSITKADEASNGLNNNLVQIIKSLDSTAEELYTTYISLDTVRESFKFLKIGADALSFSTIKGAGGVEALSSGVSAYIENFMTDEEKLTYSTALLQKEFTKLNIAMPTSKQAFKDLLASIDKTTPAGQELYGRLIILSEGFAKVSDEAENLFNDSISRITDIQNAFLDLIGIIDTTINNLLGKQTGNTTTEATITNYLQKREQVDVLLGKGSTLTETELSNLNSLVSELASMASTIQSGFEDNTAITGNLVQDLALVKSKINYSNQFVQNDLTKAKATTLATGFSEGGYTGTGGKYEIAGAVHKNEYVINSESLNAIGGVDAVKSMVQREIIQKNTNTSNTSIEYSNNKGGIIEELKKGQETLAMGFNAMLKKLEDIIDYNDERREQSHSVTVTGSVIIEG